MKLLILLVALLAVASAKVGTDVFTVCGEAPSKDNAGSFITYYGQVFGVEVYAGKEWSLDKFKHLLGVLAQYLDNDENGCPDDMKVLNKMVSIKAAMILSTEGLPEAFEETHEY